MHNICEEEIIMNSYYENLVLILKVIPNWFFFNVLPNLKLIVGTIENLYRLKFKYTGVFNISNFVSFLKNTFHTFH